jgi:hypothetical protein
VRGMRNGIFTEEICQGLVRAVEDTCERWPPDELRRDPVYQNSHGRALLKELSLTSERAETAMTSLDLDSLPRERPVVRSSVSRSIAGPVRVAWREGTLTRVKELESLSNWLTRGQMSDQPVDELLDGITWHLAAARQAAVERTWRFRPGRDAALLERAISNLDAAEADILQVASADYLLGQVPCLLNHVQRHLRVQDTRRQEFERIAADLGVRDRDHPVPAGALALSADKRREMVLDERFKIVSIVRGASSASLREQVGLRGLKTVLVATTGVMFVLALGLAFLGWVSPATLPLCFQPEQKGQTVVVCPTMSQAVPVTSDGAVQPGVDATVTTTARSGDLALVEIMGLMAAAVAAAAALRSTRGSSEPHGLPVALAMLKLPTGAITAVLGLFLMRGQFVPGLSALDTSGQIIAWAIVFGYAQQLFTRFVDQQAHSVMNNVRNSKGAEGAQAPAA